MEYNYCTKHDYDLVADMWCPFCEIERNDAEAGLTAADGERLRRDQSAWQSAEVAPLLALENERINDKLK